MKVSVDMDKCEYHGQCMIAAPEVFNLIGKDKSSTSPSPTKSTAPTSRRRRMRVRCRPS